MRKTKTHNVLRRLLAFVLIVSLLPLGYAGNVMAATTGTRNVSIQVTYGQTDARNVYGMINSMRRNSSDAWYWDANNYTKTYCNNLQPLTYDYALEQVAMKRAAEIALSYSHTRPNGTNYYTAYSENGVYAGVYAENIGVNYSSASALHNAMREDNANYSGQEQRRNMLNSQFTPFPMIAVSASPRIPTVITFSNLPLRFRPSSQNLMIPSRFVLKFHASP